MRHWGRRSLAGALAAAFRAAATAAAAAALGRRLLGHGRGQLPGHLGLRGLQLGLGAVGLAEVAGLAGLVGSVPVPAAVAAPTDRPGARLGGAELIDDRW